MRAVILAAGQGRRMRSITYAIPKPRLPLAGGTLVDYLVARLRSAGFTDIGLVVREGARGLDDDAFPGTRLIQPQPWTLGQALNTARAWASEEQPLLILHGDNLIDADLSPLPEAMAQWPVGVIWIGSDIQTGATGIYWLSKDVLEITAALPHLDHLEDLWPFLEERGVSLMALPLPGRRFNINTLNDYLEAHAYVLDHWERFSPLASWPGVYDPTSHTWIAEEARVEHSELRYVAVGPRAMVVRSRLSHCIIAPDTPVVGAQAQARVFFSV